jgi:hypothetical protein
MTMEIVPAACQSCLRDYEVKWSFRCMSKMRMKLALGMAVLALER